MVQPVETLPFVRVVAMVARDRRDIRMQLVVVKICVHASKHDCIDVCSCSLLWCLAALPICLSIYLPACCPYDENGVVKRTNRVASTDGVK